MDPKGMYIIVETSWNKLNIYKSWAHHKLEIYPFSAASQPTDKKNIQETETEKNELQNNNIIIIIIIINNNNNNQQQPTTTNKKKKEE